MNEQKIVKLIYDASDDEVKSYLKNCTDREELYVYAFNYNWEGGFEIPNIILSNSVCSITTAKLIFLRADGVNYLRNKAFDNELPQWYNFIAKLYSDITTNKFPTDNFQFVVPLSKIQKFKLKKEIATQDWFFIEDSAGIDLDIEV